jgi:hypothetical protein
MPILRWVFYFGKLYELDPRRPEGVVGEKRQWRFARE